MVVGVSMVKDEADIVGQTLRLMLAEVDYVIVADNGSTDGTRGILEDVAADLGRVKILDDPEVGYFQSRKMTALAAHAATIGADWVVPFDADERWYSPFGRVADVLMADDAMIASAELYDHVATGQDPEGDPVDRIGWRRRVPADLPKVACRPSVPVTIHQGNHHATYANTLSAGRLVVRHFPYRSVEQMIRKARNGGAAYAATDLPEHEGQHWRDYDRLSDEQLGDVFREFFWSASPERDRSLIFDPAPGSKGTP